MSIKQNSHILLWPNTIVEIDSSNPNFSQMRNYSILSSFLPKALIACINMACSLLHCTCNIKDQEERCGHGLQSSQGPLGPKYCEECRVGFDQRKSKCNIMSMVTVLSLLSFFPSPSYEGFFFLTLQVQNLIFIFHIHSLHLSTNLHCKASVAGSWKSSSPLYPSWALSNLLC